MIRNAVGSDLLTLVDMGERMHAESSYATLDFDRDKVGSQISALMRDGIVLVAEKGGRLVGGFMGGVTEFWFGRDLTGFDYALFIEPEHRHGITAVRLLTGFEAWCVSRGAKEIRLGITTGVAVEETGRFYEWFGYQRCGALFRKGIENVHGN